MSCFGTVQRRYPRGRLGRHGWCFYLWDALGTSFLLAVAGVIGCSRSLDSSAPPTTDGSVVAPDAQIIPPDAEVDAGLDCGDGLSLAPAARACSTDSDCSFLSRTYCCGQISLGVATAYRNEYSTCRPPSSSCEAGWECFPTWHTFTTDSASVNDYDPNFFTVLDQGAKVSCVQGLCTTNFAAADAGNPP